MLINFEPSDGTFEIVLGYLEPLPEQWNEQGVTVLRETGPETGVYKIESQRPRQGAKG